GYPLGIECVLLDRDLDSPGGQVAPMRQGALDDAAAIEELAKQVDVVTVEIENVPATALDAAARHAPVYPPAKAIEATQDRLVEKGLFRALGIPTADFVPVEHRDDLHAALRQLG